MCAAVGCKPRFEPAHEEFVVFRNTAGFVRSALAQDVDACLWPYASVVENGIEGHGHLVEYGRTHVLIESENVVDGSGEVVKAGEIELRNPIRWQVRSVVEGDVGLIRIHKRLQLITIHVRAENVDVR